MARYKLVHKGLKLLPVDFGRQVLPGGFEHAPRHLVDHEPDLSDFHSRYKNDIESAPTFDPAALIARAFQFRRFRVFLIKNAEKYLQNR